MNAIDLLADLARRGVRLEADAGALVVDAPADVLTDTDLAELRARKAELLRLLAPPCPACGNPGRRLGTVLIDGRGRFACDLCGRPYWAPAVPLADPPAWHDGLTDAEYAAVVDSDLAEHGSYRPDRAYVRPEPTRTPHPAELTPPCPHCGGPTHDAAAHAGGIIVLLCNDGESCRWGEAMTSAQYRVYVKERAQAAAMRQGFDSDSDTIRTP